MRASLWRARAAPRWFRHSGRGPRWSLSTSPRKKYWFWPSPVIIGTPIYPKIAGRKATAEELERITENLMAEIYRLGGGIE